MPVVEAQKKTKVEDAELVLMFFLVGNTKKKIKEHFLSLVTS